MSVRGRYGRPGRGSLLAMMALNAVVAAFVLTLVLTLFGVRSIVIPLSGGAHMQEPVSRWHLIRALLPGASIAYGCLWYWLVVVGRSRGIPWGGACIYGLLIALIDLLAAGFVLGLLAEGLGFGLLLSLVMLLMLPRLVIELAIFGISMGLLNGRAAQWWIDTLQPR